jgi:ribosome-associated protein
MSPFEMAALAANAAEDKKALNTVILETGKVSYLADYFVITSGETPSQIRAIFESIGDRLRQAGQRPLREERDQSMRWYLLDYGDIVVHIMNVRERDYYQIEQFWSHATLIPRDRWAEDNDPRRHAQAS